MLYTLLINIQETNGHSLYNNTAGKVATILNRRAPAVSKQTLKAEREVGDNNCTHVLFGADIQYTACVCKQFCGKGCECVLIYVDSRPHDRPEHVTGAAHCSTSCVLESNFPPQ